MSGLSCVFSVAKLPGILRVIAACVLLPALNALALGAEANDGSDGCFTVSGDQVAAARIPFVQNSGQVSDSSVVFYARTFGGTIYITDEGRIVYAFPLFESVGDDSADRRPVGGSVFSETLVGDAMRSIPEGVGRFGGKVNSFIGNDSARWQSDIPSYETVALGEVYQGIELSLRAHGNNVEKIFTVAPDADPSEIKLRVDGVECISLLPDGELELMTGLGPVRFTAPVAFQDEIGSSKRKAQGSKVEKEESGSRSYVQVAYRVEGEVVGFDVGPYDKSRPLIIDPLVASTFLGGGNEDVIRAMYLHHSTNDPGWTNIFVAGYTAASDFPVTAGGAYRGGSYDAFISKFDDGLTNLLASTFLGGSGDDKIYGMAFNTNAARVIVAGYTASSNFPASGSPGSYGGNGDAFVAALDTGLTLQAALFLGGSDVDVAYGVGVATNDEVYVTGSTRSSDFPTNNIYGATYMDTLQGSNDAFVAKFAADLSALQASTYIGGNADDVAFAIAVSVTNVYIAGYTMSTNFPVTEFLYDYAGGVDMMFARFTPDLTNTMAATYFGGDGDDVAYGLTLDRGGNLYVVGSTTSTNYPRDPEDNVVAPGYTNMPYGGLDAVATRLNPTLGTISFSTYIAGTGDDVARAVFVDPNTNIYITGWTSSSNFPVTANAYNTAPRGGRDVFLSTFTRLLTNMTASTYIGGGGDDVGYGVVQSPDTNFVFVAGATESGNFPKTIGAYQEFSPPDFANGFISKLIKNYAYGTEKWRSSMFFATANAVGPTFGLGGSIYIADDEGYLYSFDSNGNQIWCTEIADPLFMETCPAIGSDGTIYLCIKTNLYGINPSSGQVIMTNHVNINGTNQIYGSPAIGANGSIYVATFDPPILYAINPVAPAGEVVWSNRLVDAYFVNSSPVVSSNGVIYLATHGTESFLYAFDPDGTTKWMTTIGTHNYAAPAIGANGDIYVPSSNSLYSFSSTGTTNWVNNLGNLASITNFASPVIGSNGTVYVGLSNRLFAINGVSGSTERTWVLTGGVVKVESAAAIGEQGSIYVGAGSNLYSLNPAGTTNWALNIGRSVGLSSPLLGSDGTIYIAGGTNLVAVWGKEQIGSTPWPTFHHDLLRTRNAALGDLAPAAPVNVTASINIADRIRVNWSAVSNASLYEVWRSLSNNVASAVYLGISGTNQYDDGFVPIGYNYYYWVKSKNAFKSGSLSSSSALGGRPTIPPVGVIATDGFPTNLWQIQAQVSWSACSGTHLGYHVYRGTNTSTNAAVRLTSTSVTTTNYIDTTLPPGITNYYWVSSHNLTTTSGLSVVETGGIAPSAPTSVSVAQGTVTNDLPVNWSASPGTATYRLYRGTSTTFSASVECLDSNVNATAFNDVNAQDSIPIPYRNYTYWVRATNNFGVSAYSVSGTGYRALHPPLAVRASDGSHSNKIEVQWEVHTTNPVSYLVFRSGTNDSSTSQQLAEIPYLDTTRTNYNDLQITRGYKYYYWVRAKNAYGTSGFGPSDSGGTAPLSPTDLSVSSGTYTDKVEVAWTASVGASGYQIWRNSNVDSSQAQRVGESSTESFDDTLTAVPGTRYYYWVKATNEYGVSVFSGFDSGWRDLAPPSGVMASDGVSTSEVSVVWNTSENASAYDLWRGTNSNVNEARELYSGVSTNGYSDTSATPGEFYYYWVRARNSEFISGFGDSDVGYRSLGYIDIGVSDFIFLPAAAAPNSHPEAVSFRLANHGNDAMLAPNYWVASDFYLSANGVFGDDDDVWIGRRVGGVTLAAGASTVIKLSLSERSQLSIPSDASGTYHVFVHVNHALPSTWRDINLENNTDQRFGGAISVRGTTPVPFKVSDFSGDGKADLAVYNETSGAWFVCGADGTDIISGEYWGGEGFRPVAGDFDGDGIVDMAVYHEASGLWYIRRVDGSVILWGHDWGGSGFTPVWGDYDGDGAADLCVYHEATGTWYIRNVSGEVLAWGKAWGGPTFHPAPGDYSGDGQTDLCVFVDGSYNWFIQEMDGAIVIYALSWGGPNGYVPVPGDYNGDGVADLAVYHQNTGYWFILALTGEQILWGARWGGSEFTAVSGDFDGDGKSDIAVYHEATGAWYVQSVSGNIIVWQEILGGPGYIPLSLGQ